MKIGGHKRTKDFYKYIRISPEVAANKIKELWMKRNGMSNPIWQLPTAKLHKTDKQDTIRPLPKAQL
jgi:hypothetical protein